MILSIITIINRIGVITLRPVGKIVGLTARFDPFDRLERVNPIVLRELGEAHTMLYKKGLALYNGKFLKIALLIYIVTFVIEFVMTTWGLMYPGTPRLPSLVIWTAPSILISIGVDIYGSVRTISRWYASSRHETWDTLRLAMRDDAEVIHTYEALGNIAAWDVFRFDMAMRALPTALGVLFGIVTMVGTVIGLVVHLAKATPFGPLDILVLIVSGYFWIRVAILYSSDPIWRFRANTLWSLICAMWFRDMATSIMAAVAGGLGVRMLHLGAILAVYKSWELVAESSSTLTITPILWIATTGCAVIPITRWGYRQLYTWLEHRALGTLAA